MLWLILTCILAFLLAYYALQDLYLMYVRHFPPGPLSLPLIGGLHHLHPRHPHISTKHLVQKYGPVFSLRMGVAGHAVFLQDIKLIDKLFESSVMNDRPHQAIFDILSSEADGIGSCQYGERWKKMTKKFNRGLAKLSQTSLKEKSNHAYEQLMQKISTNRDTAYNMKCEVIKSLSAIFSSLVYGLPLESIDSSQLQSRIKYHNCFMQSLNPAHPVNICPPLWNLPLPDKDKILNGLQERDEMMKQNLDNHILQCTGDVEDVMDIVANFVQTQGHTKERPDDAEASISKEDMLKSVWCIYMAGCETMVIEIMWIILYMSMYPDVQKKVQEEVDKVVCLDINNSLEQKHNLNYTRAVILECLRLSSPVALGIPHYTAEQVQLGDFTIPKGTLIMPNQYYIHHDENLWPDPDTLKPERFLDEDGHLVSMTQLRTMPFIPFSRGRRTCLGKHVALDLLLVFITTLLQRFTLTLPDGCKPDLCGVLSLNRQPVDTPIIFNAR